MLGPMVCVVGENQHTDTHSVIDHQQAHCVSHQLYKEFLTPMAGQS
jgi:Fe-S cluster assembly scaffold protein SufB